MTAKRTRTGPGIAFLALSQYISITKQKISMNTKLVVFDLDGTLVDSSQTIYDATIQTFIKLGIDYKLTREDLDKRIGAHFQDIFEEFNIYVEDFEYFIEVYKVYYFEYMNSSHLYPGVGETIKALHERGIKIALLTTKGQDQAERIIEHFEFTKYFSLIMGRHPDLKVKPDPEPLLYIASQLNVPNEQVLMTGDTEFDIRCGKNAGIRTCACEYGYRTREFLESENPDHIIEKIVDIMELV